MHTWKLPINARQPLDGTFTTPKGPYDHFVTEVSTEVSSRLDQWWHPRAKAVATSQHKDAPSSGSKIAEVRRIGENSDSMTVVSDEIHAMYCRCISGSNGWCGWYHDSKGNFRADIVADLTIEEQLYGAAQALPSFISAEKAKEKRLTDQTAIADEVHFEATGLDLSANPSAWNTRMIVEGTNPDGAIDEKFLPRNGKSLSGSYTFQNADKETTGRQGVKRGTYSFDRDDIAFSKDQFIHTNAGFINQNQENILRIRQ